MKTRVIVWMSWNENDKLLHCTDSGFFLGSLAPGAVLTSGGSLTLRLCKVGGVFRMSTMPVRALLLCFFFLESGLGKLLVSSMSATCSGVNVYSLGMESFSSQAMVSFSDRVGWLSLSDKIASMSL